MSAELSVLAESVLAEAEFRVAVVIVCWNNKSLIDECIESVRAQTVCARIIVADNASDDGSAEHVRATYPDVDVLDIGWNSGFSHANNVAIRTAFEDREVRGVVLLNSDARLAPDWIATVTAFAATRPLGACFQALTLDHNNPAVIDSHHLFLQRSLHAIQDGTGAVDRGSHHSERVFGVNAAAALYSRAFLETQPFETILDERMGMYLEDVDLSMRALCMGWENWFVAGTHATHIGSASTKTRSSGFALRQTWRNQTVLLVSNLPWRLFVRGFRLFVKQENDAVRHLRSTGQSSLVKEIARGRLEGLRLVPYALNRRKTLKPRVVVDPETLWDLMRTGVVSR